MGDCTRRAVTKGLCTGHYSRRGTDIPDDQPLKPDRRRPCSVADCDRPSEAHQLCRLHHYRWKRHGDPLTTVIAPKGSGHTRIKKGGYRYIVVDGKQVTEHRWVMAVKLGRPLLDDEHVHHINGVPWDNRPENLELWSTSHPYGQRVDDKVAWALEIVRRYAPEHLVIGDLSAT